MESIPGMDSLNENKDVMLPFAAPLIASSVNIAHH